MKRKIRLLAAIAALTPLCSAFAQDYPARTVRVIVPFPPGGSNDLIARQVATQLSGRLGKQFVIDNRGGAGGIVGTEMVAKSPPDGYNLLVISVAFPMGAAVYTKLPYDPARAFAPVVHLGTGPNVLSVHPSLPVKTLKELLALARARPGHLQYASAGVGTFQHLSAEMFKSMAKVDIVHVPYKGGGPATIDTLSGQVHMTIGSLIQVLPHFRTGRLRPIATGGAKRAAALPEIPTIAESGVPGYEANNWWGILAPVGTPDAVIRKINAEANAVTMLADTQKRLASEGVETIAATPEQFGRHIAAEMAKWLKVTKDANIKAE